DNDDETPLRLNNGYEPSLCPVDALVRLDGLKFINNFAAAGGDSMKKSLLLAGRQAPENQAEVLKRA
ncbi:MAG: hypothetical protein K8I30_16995, partial [Anaerolineae bacterium]|nr:hypothetical protein [Anaerolineae bacterium]